LSGQRQRLRLFKTHERTFVGQKWLGMSPPHHHGGEPTQAEQ